VRIVRDAEHDLDDETTPGTVVTIGAFDGVHRGHRAVLRLVRELADARGLRAALVTFDRHPAEIVRPESAPKLLTTLDHRLELLDATGLLDVCLVLTFDEARSHESAADFVTEVLVGQLHARVVVVGADFHFGHRRGGNVALLEQMGAGLGFEVLGLGLVAPESGSIPFSSTLVRELLAAGDVEAAAEVLGRPHEQRGTLAGAELWVDERMCLPAQGRYAGTATQSDGSDRDAVIAVGADTPDGDVRVRAGLAGGVSAAPGRVRFVSRLDGPPGHGGR
jgi:riboflavin kinase/FMN adenylyltransferase